MLRVGLTGGIGSGKSAAARILGTLGAGLIDADLVGHASYRAGTEGFDRVIEAFGDDLIGSDGEIDRKKLGPIVFSEPGNLTRLNEILHPIIYSMIKTELKNMENSGEKVAVVEAAILIEANWQDLFDELWVVDADKEEVIRRLIDRNNVTREQALERIESQIGREERNGYADAIIKNNAGLLELEKNISCLWNDRTSQRGA